MREKKYAEGEWKAFRMVHADHGGVMTPEEIGEYVKNSVINSAKESGTMDYTFVCCTKENGDYDVCHTGNGPTSKYNAALICAAPELVKALEHQCLSCENTQLCPDCVIGRALSKAYGEMP